MIQQATTCGSFQHRSRYHRGAAGGAGEKQREELEREKEEAAARDAQLAEEAEDEADRAAAESARSDCADRSMLTGRGEQCRKGVPDTLSTTPTARNAS